jgi:hypothetical protein
MPKRLQQMQDFAFGRTEERFALLRENLGMVCRSFRSMSSSMSSACQRKRSESARATVLLPLAMNPTR